MNNLLESFQWLEQSKNQPQFYSQFYLLKNRNVDALGLVQNLFLLLVFVYFCFYNLWFVFYFNPGDK